MLVVTEVFIAPPTHRDGKREMGEGGCFVQKDEERERVMMRQRYSGKKM